MIQKLIFYFLWIAVGISSVAGAMDCLEGQSGQALSLATLISEVEFGSYFFLGEIHGQKLVADGQMEILRGLREQGHHVDLSFEFFSYVFQDELDRYIQKSLPEAEFLTAVGWSKGTDFSFYRNQVQFPDSEGWGERVFAINAPRTLTGAIAKRGLAGLTTEEKNLLPPHLQMGREGYLARFREVMGDHVDEAALVRYFQAQSVWDDTMAWQLSQQINTHTKVIVVGEFHTQYGGGLPFQLRQRSPNARLYTLSFLNSKDLNSEELTRLTQPHPQWGPRSDYICLVNL